VQKEPKSLQQERLLVSKYGKNALAAGALPGAQQEELTVLPQTPAGFCKGKMGKRKEEEKCQKGGRGDEGQKGGE